MSTAEAGGQRDRSQLIRFCIAGGSVAVLYVLAYAGLLAAGAPQAGANAAAFVLAVAVQYVLQTRWTFRRPLARPGQAARFACTIAAGFAVSALITGALGPALGLAPWLAAAAAAMLLPVQNFIIFRLWVYALPG
ncbi:GtrA family protein [Cribrihabitans neustonicus]|uniref:GtrA family protein n=1 Tax=Cribrihabitans neustonicus TaxID=1429085 RepID=UPI003B5A34D3